MYLNALDNVWKRKDTTDYLNIYCDNTEDNESRIQRNVLLDYFFILHLSSSVAKISAAAVARCYICIKQQPAVAFLHATLEIADACEKMKKRRRIMRQNLQCLVNNSELIKNNDCFFFSLHLRDPA